MAVIGKIRERSTLLLIIIGGAMVAFILGDFFSRNNTGPQDQFVGEVYGDEINMVEYERRVQERQQNLATMGQPVSGAAEQQLRNQVWNDMLQEKIMYNELNKLGMRVSQEELDDIRFGENVMPSYASSENFKNPETGQFDPKLVQNYFSFLQQQYPLFYKDQINQIVNNRLYEKYNNMVRAGLYVNTLEAKDEYYRQSQTVDFSYAAREYTSVPDSTVEVSEDELRAYYEEHKNEPRFDRNASADVHFVAFDVVPTAADSAALRQELASLKSDFEQAKNDSLFTAKYSDSRTAAVQELDAKNNDNLQQLIDSAEVGDVIGPYLNGNRYSLAKIVTKGGKPEATVRHILLSNEGGVDMDVLRARADSIIKVIKQKNNFEEMVTAFSDDPGSVPNGGRYEWFDKKTMVEPFTESSFNDPIGSLNVVETQYGVHIVEPLERRERKVVEAYVIDEAIQPSSDTFDQVYDLANAFSLEAKQAEAMPALAEEKGYELKEGKNLSSQSRNLPGIASSVDAIRWMHNANETEVGEVSQPFEFGNSIVVLGLTERREAGIAEFEDVVEEIKPEVIREQKAEQFKEEMRGKNLEQLKAELGLEIKQATNLSEKRPSLPGGASEPYVVGYALSMEEGAVSDPLEGNRGVYVIRLESKADVEPKENYAVYRDELTENRQNAFRDYTTGVYRSLKELANVKDRRMTM